jgi:ATP-dependent RNA helicase DDX55/SPB4
MNDPALDGTTLATAGPFSSLSLHPTVLSSLSGLGFTQMTPVQASAIPELLRNRDIVCEASTGSGKTLAFLVPVFDRLLRNRPAPRSVGALVVAPTRELAEQIYTVAHGLMAGSGLAVQLMVGGRGQATALEDVAKLRREGCALLIGCPGRLEFMVAATPPPVSLRELEVLVFDEADRLLHMGFERSITALLSALPKQRRTALFSATQTKDVVELVRAGLRNPVRVQVKVENSRTKHGQATPAALTNYFLLCPLEEKLGQLVHFLAARAADSANCRIIVFFLTCACVDYFAKVLGELVKTCGLRLPALYSLHGKQETRKRTLNFESFTAQGPNSGEEARALLCTDVAARGLDVPDVDWIVQFDPPQDPKAFVHRVGRTARMGKRGKSLAILCGESEAQYLEYLANRRVPLAEYPDVPPVAEIAALRVPERVRELTRADRDILERGHLAFVSFVRGYKEHELKFIFSQRALFADFKALAVAFGLLSLPKMPELKRLPKIDLGDPQCSVKDIPFKDPKREAARQVREGKRLADEERRALHGPTPEERAAEERKERIRMSRIPWSKNKEEKRLKREKKAGKLQKKEARGEAGAAADKERAQRRAIRASEDRKKIVMQAISDFGAGSSDDSNDDDSTSRPKKKKRKMA